MTTQSDAQAASGTPTDIDLQETREWMEALSAVIEKGRPGTRPLPAGATA